MEQRKTHDISTIAHGTFSPSNDLRSISERVFGCLADIEQLTAWFTRPAVDTDQTGTQLRARRTENSARIFPGGPGNSSTPAVSCHPQKPAHRLRHRHASDTGNTITVALDGLEIDPRGEKATRYGLTPSSGLPRRNQVNRRALPRGSAVYGSSGRTGRILAQEP